MHPVDKPRLPRVGRTPWCLGEPVIRFGHQIVAHLNRLVGQQKKRGFL